MIKQSQEGAILFTGVTVNDLLLRIEQLIDAKICISPPKKHHESGYLSRKEVASLLKITLPTLHDWSKLGYLKKLEDRLQGALQRV